MAISLIKEPVDWGRVYDTNRLTYEFSSSNWQQPNFQFQFNMRYYNVDGTYKDLGTYNVYPLSGGTVEFNPSSIYRNFCIPEFKASETGLYECETFVRQFQLFVYEYYGTPPVRINSGNWYESTPKVFYMGCQQPIPYDYVALNPKMNKLWVMSGSTSGKFLTDANRWELDTDDFLFLYALGNNTNGRPTRIRYKIYYMGWLYTENINIDGPQGFGTGYLDENLQMSLTTSRQTDIATGGESTIITGTTGGGGTIIGGGGGVPIGHWYSGLTSVTYYDTNITFNYNNSRGYYFPCGPYQMKNYLSMLTGTTAGWMYYEIDIMSGNTVLNAVPMQVFRKSKCGKYDKVQIFWLNAHGGFDTYTFASKKEINYKVNRTTYKQKLPSSSQFTYNPYDAGEKVFNVNYQMEYTLRTTNLTQMESQLLMGLVTSPTVYMLRTYDYNGGTYPYAVPMIITTDGIKYEQKKNDKVIFMEIKMRPSNENIVQMGQ